MQSCGCRGITCDPQRHHSDTSTAAQVAATRWWWWKRSTTHPIRGCAAGCVLSCQGPMIALQFVLSRPHAARAQRSPVRPGVAQQPQGSVRGPQHGSSHPLYNYNSRRGERRILCNVRTAAQRVPPGTFYRGLPTATYRCVRSVDRT